MILVPNGVFELAIVDSYPSASWRDTPTRPIEKRLNDFVARLHVVADKVKRREMEWQAQRRAEEAERQRRAEEQRRAEQEAHRAKQLTETVGHWKLANEIREFVGAVRAAHSDGRMRASEADLAWALAYADRLDPLRPGGG